MNGGSVENRKLKLLLMTTSYPTREGSHEGVFVERLARELALKAQVKVLCPHGPGLPRRETRGEVEIFRFRYSPSFLENLAYGQGGIPAKLAEDKRAYLSVPPFLASFAYHAARLGRSADVIHANWAVSGAVAALTGPLHKKPYVLTLRGSEMRGDGGGLKKKLLETATRRARYVTSVNESFVEGRDPAKYKFIPNGVELPGEAPSPVSGDGRFNFVFVGSMIERKRVLDLAKAFSLLPPSVDAGLILVGDGPLRGEVEDFVSARGLGGKVAFRGSLSHGGAMAEIGAADCLVLPSVWEGRPNVLLEAMAMGRPFIASSLPGVMEFVDRGAPGLVFEPGDIGNLAVKMAVLAADRQRAAGMGGRGPAFLKDNGLTWENSAASYLELFINAAGTQCAESSAQ